MLSEFVRTLRLLRFEEGKRLLLLPSALRLCMRGDPVAIGAAAAGGGGGVALLVLSLERDLDASLALLSRDRLLSLSRCWTVCPELVLISSRPPPLALLLPLLVGTARNCRAVASLRIVLESSRLSARILDAPPLAKGGEEKRPIEY